MASTLRLVCIFTRWDAIHVCLLTLSGKPLAENGGRLERREADPQTDVLNAGIPIFDGLVIEPKPKLLPPPPPPQVAFGRMAFGSRFLDAEEQSSPSEHDEKDSCREIAVVARNILATGLPEMSEGAAVVSKSPMAVKYTVDELTTIPSDGKSHKVLVAIVVELYGRFSVSPLWHMFPHSDHCIYVTRAYCI